MGDNKPAVLLENLRAQFRTFGEGLQLLNDKVDNGFKENSREHQQISMMIKEPDKEVIQIKQVNYWPAFSFFNHERHEIHEMNSFIFDGINTDLLD